MDSNSHKQAEEAEDFEDLKMKNKLIKYKMKKMKYLIHGKIFC